MDGKTGMVTPASTPGPRRPIAITVQAISKNTMTIVETQIFFILPPFVDDVCLATHLGGGHWPRPRFSMASTTIPVPMVINRMSWATRT
jgi:hypothetical protein